MCVCVCVCVCTCITNVVGTYSKSVSDIDIVGTHLTSEDINTCIL